MPTTMKIIRNVYPDMAPEAFRALKPRQLVRAVNFDNRAIHTMLVIDEFRPGAALGGYIRTFDLDAEPGDLDFYSVTGESDAAAEEPVVMLGSRAALLMQLIEVFQLTHSIGAYSGRGETLWAGPKGTTVTASTVPASIDLIRESRLDLTLEALSELLARCAGVAGFSLPVHVPMPDGHDDYQHRFTLTGAQGPVDLEVFVGGAVDDDDYCGITVVFPNLTLPPDPTTPEQRAAKQRAQTAKAKRVQKAKAKPAKPAKKRVAA